MCIYTYIFIHLLGCKWSICKSNNFLHRTPTDFLLLQELLGIPPAQRWSLIRRLLLPFMGGVRITFKIKTVWPRGLYMDVSCTQRLWWSYKQLCSLDPFWPQARSSGFAPGLEPRPFMALSFPLLWFMADAGPVDKIVAPAAMQFNPLNPNYSPKLHHQATTWSELEVKSVAHNCMRKWHPTLEHWQNKLLWACRLYTLVSASVSGDFGA